MEDVGKLRKFRDNLLKARPNPANTPVLNPLNGQVLNFRSRNLLDCRLQQVEWQISRIEKKLESARELEIADPC